MVGNKQNVKSQVEEAKNNIDLEKNSYDIHFDTSKGLIKLELYPEQAPNHVKNIVALSEIGFYDDLIFHRIIPGFMIQGGCPIGEGTGGPGYNVAQEFNATKHEPGVLSMARAMDPDSAGSQFFVCLDAHSHLDNQYTVFGKTKDEDSLNIVKAIGSVETGANDKPVEDVVIKKASVIKTAK